MPGVCSAQSYSEKRFAISAPIAPGRSVHQDYGDYEDEPDCVLPVQPVPFKILFIEMAIHMSSQVQNENRSRFDAIAAQWDDSPMRSGMANAVADSILAAVPVRPQWRTLEYGCGTGLVGLRLLPHVGHVLETDLSPGMLAVLSEKAAAAGLDKIDTQVLDLTSSPPPAERFDLIFSSMAMHHIPDVAALIRTFYSMLNPGGWLALADLDAEDGSFHPPDVPGVAHHGFERKTMESWLRATGFSSVTTRTAHTVAKDRDGKACEYPIFLATGQRI